MIQERGNNQVFPLLYSLVGMKNSGQRPIVGVLPLVSATELAGRCEKFNCVTGRLVNNLLDIKGDDLSGEAAVLKSELEDLKRKLGKKEGEERKKLDKRIKKKEKKLEIVTLKLDKHKANDLMKGKPDEERAAFLNSLQKQIDELE
ncbi:hypothetical protein K469DRAFT_751809 [Zopfia rhizophila CBS 207.26]|uniref:Uncharacterized protein n=1 Tax=Zopfia rhizophila CBS 207.26 TaxID=1314779 RepID=A0A6A6DWV1_9PEZI|nr:hypothetical protein K469DRAFT_751809 [Zopfia rhizophila CBS 207.26]